MNRRRALLFCAASTFGVLGVACSLTVDLDSLTGKGPIDAGGDAPGMGIVGPTDGGSDAAEEAEAAAAPCTAAGQRCPDGTVYVVARNGGTLYTTPCDVGQISLQGLCAGDRQQLAYNNGNSTGGTFVGATSPDDGLANTNMLVGADSDSSTVGVQPHLAARACADLVFGGHEDWYLPAIDELNELYLARTVIGGFDTSTAYYKSSTETHSAAEPYNAAGQTFSNGYQYIDGDSKPTPGPVRCTRYSP